MNSQTRLVLALAFIVAGYAASADLTGVLIESVHGIRCETSFLTTLCAYPADLPVLGRAHVWLAAFLCLAGVASHFIRRSAAYPFLALTIILCSSAVLWDCVFQRAVLHGPKIVNDSLNILGAVIAASFVLIVVLIRDRPFSLRKLAVAVALSFGVKALSSVAYVSLSSTLFGATELFLLYVIYSFGSFTVHLMTVCGFISSVSEMRVREVAR